jgi:hypothetical protein
MRTSFIVRKAVHMTLPEILNMSDRVAAGFPPGYGGQLAV